MAFTTNIKKITKKEANMEGRGTREEEGNGNSLEVGGAEEIEEEEEDGKRVGIRLLKGKNG
jgi:hypothetical protein